MFPDCPEPGASPAARLDFERRLKNYIYWLADRPLARKESHETGRTPVAGETGWPVSVSRAGVLGHQYGPVRLPVAGDGMILADAAMEEQSNFDAEFPVRLPRWTWR